MMCFHDKSPSSPMPGYTATQVCKKGSQAQKAGEDGRPKTESQKMEPCTYVLEQWQR